VNPIVLNFVLFILPKEVMFFDSNLLKLTLSLSDQVYNLIAQIEVYLLAFG
jgi:hypothetical protein